MDKIQKVLVAAGRKDLAQKYYQKIAALRHVQDRSNNVVTTPESVLEQIAAGLQSVIEGSASDDFSMVIDIDSPYVTNLKLVFETGGTWGDYPKISLYSITADGKKNIIQSWQFADKVFYMEHTKSWWLGPNHPSHENPQAAQAAINDIIPKIQKFLKTYITKLKTSKGGADLQIALRLNRALKLNLDEQALAKLFAAMEA